MFFRLVFKNLQSTVHAWVPQHKQQFMTLLKRDWGLKRKWCILLWPVSVPFAANKALYISDPTASGPGEQWLLVMFQQLFTYLKADVSFLSFSRFSKPHLTIFCKHSRFAVYQVFRAFLLRAETKSKCLTPGLRGGHINTYDIGKPMNVLQNNVCFFLKQHHSVGTLSLQPFTIPHSFFALLLPSSYPSFNVLHLIYSLSAFAFVELYVIDLRLFLQWILNSNLSLEERI